MYFKVFLVDLLCFKIHWVLLCLMVKYFFIIINSDGTETTKTTEINTLITKTGLVNYW